MKNLKTTSELTKDLKGVWKHPDLVCTYLKHNMESFQALDPAESLNARILYKLYQTYAHLTSLISAL